MKLKRYCCQEDNLPNPNKDKFWDEKLKNHRKIILKSPVFIHKNKLIISQLKKISGNILDIGFGYGYIEYLIEKLNLNLSVYGIDISEGMLQTARRNAEKFGVKNVKFVKSDLEKIDLPSNPKQNAKT